VDWANSRAGAKPARKTAEAMQDIERFIDSGTANLAVPRANEFNDDLVRLPDDLVSSN
jgi:hypothetical protein